MTDIAILHFVDRDDTSRTFCSGEKWRAPCPLNVSVALCLDCYLRTLKELNLA